MTTDPGDGLAGALADPLFASLLADLDAVADAPPPPIGDALAAVLDGTVPIPSTRQRRSRVASIAAVGLLSGGVLAGGVGAAAADELPAPVQRVVARVISTLTPFEVPHPDRSPTRRDHGSQPPDQPAQPTRPAPVVPDEDRDDDTEELPATRPGDHGETDGADEVRDDATGSDDTTDDTRDFRGDDQDEGSRETEAEREGGDRSSDGDEAPDCDSAEQDGDRSDRSDRSGGDDEPEGGATDDGSGGDD
jgi:hypothetical protein